MKAAAKPADASWLWTLAYGRHEDRTPTHGYEPQGGDGRVAGAGSEASATAPKLDAKLKLGPHWNLSRCAHFRKSHARADHA